MKDRVKEFYPRFFSHPSHSSHVSHASYGSYS